MRSDELEQLLGRRVTRVRRRPFAYGSSHPLHALSVELADGAAVELIEKDTHHLLPAAQAAKPDFLRDAERELEVYREVLPRSGVGSPEFVGVSGHTLVMERVDGIPLTEVGDLAVWRCAATEIARMHRLLRGRATARLLRCDLSFFARWLERARVFAGAAVDDLAVPYREAVERILQLQPTLIHGELYPANVLVAGGRVCPLDWETAAVGPALLDLAALTSGNGWTDGQRREIVSAYAKEAGLNELAMSADLDRCRLVVAVQWIGWSATWSPPAPQKHDWLADARRVAEAIA